MLHKQWAPVFTGVTTFYEFINVASCKTSAIEAFIPLGREKYNRPLTERFAQPASRPDDAEPVEEMRYKLKTEEGCTVYAKRNCTVDPVYNIIKHVQGFR